ncbi:dipeptide epimerase [Pedobacter sp. SL55]|uniref:dipeptide epimerase n=1 Tax=Pedobacter sp. SL55 TaxID=2995161 RepID=UPI00226DCBE7|nr:dipeptide epimerase [Pedobacter sp. SL55]WAC40386.1 dipeptide epimerase [Pedobacter sp. SL55]
MKLSFKNLELSLEYPFGIASYTRTSHPIVSISITQNGMVGYGEASMAKYLGETQESVGNFLKKVDLSNFCAQNSIESIMTYVEELAPNNTAAKTAIDIALHDLRGKLLGVPCYQFVQADPKNMPVTSLTIGIDNLDMIRKKVRGAAGFKALKIKLGSHQDKEIINTVREETEVPLYIDANQGWTDKHEALEMIHWLAEKGTEFIEQPMDRNNRDDNAWITAHSPIPIIADEAMQRLSDLENLKGLYHGINIKLMKCTGLLEASKIISSARALDLKIMVGCMSETSCGIMAGAAIAPLCDWADLDGPWLITNNPFEKPMLVDGKIQLKNQAGLGLTLL